MACLIGGLLGVKSYPVVPIDVPEVNLVVRLVAVTGRDTIRPCNAYSPVALGFREPIPKRNPVPIYLDNDACITVYETLSDSGP